jgi:hypothetical protein
MWLLEGFAFAPLEDLLHHPNFVELWTALFAFVPFSLRLTLCCTREGNNSKVSKFFT